MKDKDHVSKASLVLFTICTASGWFYYTRIFGTSINIPLLSKGKVDGWIAFAAYIAVSFLFSYVATKLNADRTKLLVETGIGYGAFVIAVFFRNGIHYLSVIILAVVTMFYIAYVLFRIRSRIVGIPLMMRRRRKRSLRKWMKKELVKYSSTGSFHSLGIIYLAMIVFTSIQALDIHTDVEFNLMCKGADHVETETDHDWETMMKTDLFRENIGVIKSFSYENWRNISTSEKLILLNKLCEVEAEYLGIDPPTVHIFERKADSRVAGYYNHSKRSIYLEETQLNCVEDTLEDTLHELRHSYQHFICEHVSDIPDELRDVELYRNISMWKNEFDNYISGDDEDQSIISYYRQSCEEDARSYSNVAKWYLELANAQTDAYTEFILTSGRVR